jgi:esterase/lipase superfamily enzyme
MITVGTSFGAFHAMSFGLKYPFETGRILAIAGLYDIRRFTDGYSDDYVYFNNPMQFIAGEQDAHRLAALRRLDIIMPVGNADPLIQHSRDMSGMLWSKGIGNALREWNGWCHDWPYWHRMIPMYIGGHD